MEESVARAERTLSLLTGTYLATADAATANIALVLDIVLSQNLFVYGDAAGTTEGTAKRYSTAVHKWVTRISSLAAGKTSDLRLAGVLLMKHTALQSPALFAENAPKWTATLVSMLGKAEITPLLAAVLGTLVAFIDAVRDMPVLHREVASAQVPRINQALLAIAEKSPDLAGPVLGALEHSATWYPTLFRPSADKAEALCLRLLDGSSSRLEPSMCQTAAHCLAALSLVGGKLSVEERWFQLAQQAVGTLTQCVDHIMCVDPAANGTEARQHFALPALPSDYTVSIPQAADRVSAMCDVLVALLTLPATSDIPIPVVNIAGAASKLAIVPVRVATSKSPRAEFALVSPLAPQLQRAAIRIMAALAISLGEHMQPLLSTVARAATAINTQHVASPATRVALHGLVRLYIEKYGFGFTVHLPYELVTSMVDDICVQQGPTSTAEAAAAPVETAPQQKKKRGSNGASRAAGLSESAPALHIHWNDVVLASLQTAAVLLQHTPTALCSALRTKIDRSVLTLLMLATTGGMELPYAARQSGAPLRVLLYKCLEASILSPDPWQKSILPHAVAMFHAGLDDPSGAVQAACQSALVATDLIVHARLPAQLREPDSEEGIDAELQVPQMLRADGSAVSISAALSATHLDEQQPSMDDINGRPADATTAAENAKRPKYEAVDPAPAPRPVESPAAVPAVPRSSHGAQQDWPARPPAARTPAAAPKPAVRVQTPSAGGDASDSDDEAIPDIVMEGSDSGED
ncbi:hypothetical protein H4R19_000673 [Coemansia spiralis]|nr:hypothetical protein H4R19_000673 [Coemansia spiralis]